MHWLDMKFSIHVASGETLEAVTILLAILIAVWEAVFRTRTKGDYDPDYD